MLIYTFVVAGIASMFQPQDFTPTIRVSTPYQCAMNAAKPGTSVIVENVNNGLTSHCIVTGSGPFYGGRILDAAPLVASELGYSGLARVRVYKIDGRVQPCRSYPQPQTCARPSACLLSLPKPAILECSK